MKVDEFERTKARLLKITEKRKGDGGLSQEAVDQINEALGLKKK